MKNQHYISHVKATTAVMLQVLVAVL